MIILAAAEQRRVFAAEQVRELIRRLANQQQADASRIIDVLADTRARLIARAAGGSEFDSFRANDLLRSVDAEIRRMRNQLRGPMLRSMTSALELGDAGIVSQATALVGDEVVLSQGVDLVLIEFAESTSFDLVDQISTRLRGDLSLAIRGAATGASTPADVARAIGDVVRRAQRPTGVFGKVSTQVERIHRTEVSKLYEGASEVRQRRVARESPFEMRKRWISVRDHRRRASHKRMHLVEVPSDEHFNFGAPEPWQRVSYEQAERDGGKLGTKVLGPLDSVLPAQHVVNCRCTKGLVKGKRRGSS